MKKKYLLLFSLLLLSGCNNESPIPKEIENFVHNISFDYSFKNITSGHFTQSYVEYKNNQLVGENSIDFTFSRQDEDTFYFKAVYTYNGNQIKDEIKSKTIELTNLSYDSYEIKKIENEKESREVYNAEFAYDCYYAIFDSGVNVYRVGGLYYGDFTAINLNKFYSYYSLNDSKDILTMKEENASYYDNVILSQSYSIDKNGMLLNKREHAQIKDSIDYGLLLQEASYVYKEVI